MLPSRLTKNGDCTLMNVRTDSGNKTCVYVQLFSLTMVCLFSLLCGGAILRSCTAQSPKIDLDNLLSVLLFYYLCFISMLLGLCCALCHTKA